MVAEAAIQQMQARAADEFVPVDVQPVPPA